MTDVRSRLKLAKDELRGLVPIFRRLESKGISLADSAQGMNRLANVLGVVVDELGRLQKEQMAIANDLGDHLLSHEWEYPTGAELREYLAFMREERKK